MYRDGLRAFHMTSKPTSKSYRVVAISLYDDEAIAADRLTDLLRRGGWPKANRSLIMREAWIRLEEGLAGMSTHEAFHYLAARQAKRAARPATVRESRHSAHAKPLDPAD